MRRQIGRALRRAEQGRELDANEASALMAATGHALDDLLSLASAMRDRGLADAGRPGVITYSRKVFIPLTRLCRDRCHYCTFVAAPADVPSPYLSPDEVLAIARSGAAEQCKEALFTLGDRPEDRWPQARAWLDAAGYASTLDYLRAMAVLVLEETGLLPHLNPGVLSWQELMLLKPVAPSMGLMLETTSKRLWSTPGAAALRIARQGASRSAATSSRTRDVCRSRSRPESWSASARRCTSGPRVFWRSGRLIAPMGTCRR